MVIVLPDQAAETPAGKPETVPIPVAPVVAMVILGEIAEPKQTLGELDGVPAVLLSITVIVPVALTVPQPPLKGIV